MIPCCTTISSSSSNVIITPVLSESSSIAWAKARTSRTRVSLFFIETDHFSSNGLTIKTSKRLKSRTFRVTTVKLWTMAVAAIMASS